MKRNKKRKRSSGKKEKKKRKEKRALKIKKEGGKVKEKVGNFCGNVNFWKNI